jgi:Holliday junction resolvase
MHKHGKKDQNHNAISDACRDIGATIIDTSALGGGAPDFIAGYRGTNYLFEVKRDRKAKLTDQQQKKHTAWNGAMYVVTEPHEAVTILLYNK